MYIHILLLIVHWSKQVTWAHLAPQRLGVSTPPKSLEIRQLEYWCTHTVTTKAIDLEKLNKASPFLQIQKYILEELKT